MIKAPQPHDIVTYMAAFTVAVFIFIYPDKTDALLYIAGAFTTINGGQAIGNLGLGGKRMMQGGAVEPDKIVAPAAEPATVAPSASAPSFRTTPETK